MTGDKGEGGGPTGPRGYVGPVGPRGLKGNKGDIGGAISGSITVGNNNEVILSGIRDTPFTGLAPVLYNPVTGELSFDTASTHP